MHDPSIIHPLARPDVPTGQIRFVHTDGKEHCYYSAVNDLTGDRMSGFDSNPPTIGNTLAEVRTVFGNIKAKAKVLEVIGDF